MISLLSDLICVVQSSFPSSSILIIHFAPHIPYSWYFFKKLTCFWSFSVSIRISSSSILAINSHFASHKALLSVAVSFRFMSFFTYTILGSWSAYLKIVVSILFVEASLIMISSKSEKVWLNIELIASDSRDLFPL